ncbi:MAG: hypothetical protein FWD04_03870 [Conexibacteraceae bacterium]|nr:hypothetical protein [Conexibacteraceae bacterium]
MVYPPGHLEQVQRINAPANRGQRRMRLVAVGATLLACVVGIVVWSLTSSGGTQSATHHAGCISFGFMTVIGSSSDTACGATARNLCLAPVPKLVKDGDYYAQMHRACRRAGLATSSDAAISSS